MKLRINLIVISLQIFCCYQCLGEIPNQNNHQKNFDKNRRLMVKTVQKYGIKDKKVLNALGKIPRHKYIPRDYQNYCNPYGDHPCPIGFNQTISQPYIVAYMTEKMKIKPNEKILEIGTGSGYQAAILSELGGQVFTIEIVKELALHARSVLASEGYKNVKVKRGDGYKGWPEYSPFNVIIVTCAPYKVPQNLITQLKEGGRMIIPIGRYHQRLVILKKENNQIRITKDLSVRFVPMVKE